jgi:hypothetical protein
MCLGATRCRVRLRASTTEGRAGQADGSHDGRMDFGFGLELILDGLERLLDAPRSGSPSALSLQT